MGGGGGGWGGREMLKHDRKVPLSSHSLDNTPYLIIAVINNKF